MDDLLSAFETLRKRHSECEDVRQFEDDLRHIPVSFGSNSKRSRMCCRRGQLSDQFDIRDATGS